MAALKAIYDSLQVIGTILGAFELLFKVNRFLWKKILGIAKTHRN